MKIFYNLILVLILITYNFSFAIDSPFNFLRYQSNARNAALGGSVIALENDAAAFLFNPSLISKVEDKQMQVTFLKHVLDINSGNVSYINQNEYGSFAAAVGFTTYGSFDYADKIGNRTGTTFTASDLTFGITYANKLDTNLYYGITAKYIYAGIEKVSTSALAFDVGLIYNLADGRTNFAVSILHAGTQLTKISNQSEPLPLDVRIGFNHRLRGLPLLFNFSFHHLADETSSFFARFKSFNIGGEFYISDNINLRLGYDNNVRNLTDAEVNKGLTGFSGGAGFNLDDFLIDYGFSRYGSSANLHRFSISFNINKLL